MFDSLGNQIGGVYDTASEYATETYTRTKDKIGDFFGDGSEQGSEPATLIQSMLTKKMEQNPQFDFLWRVEMPEIQMEPVGQPDSRLLNDPNSFLTQADIEEFTGMSDIQDINHRIYEFNAPYVSFDTRKSIDRGTYRYAAGHSDIGTISMTVDEMEDGLTLEYFLDWQKRIKNADGSSNPPKHYKKNIRFIRLSATKLELTYSVYKNFFPIEIQPTSNSYEGNGITQFQVTLSGDSVEHHVIDRQRVMSAIAQVEQRVMAKDFRSSGFNFGSFDSQKQMAIFDRISTMF